MKSKYKLISRKFFCAVVAIGITIFAIFAIVACGSEPTAESVAKSFESYWGFDLPRDMELEFYEYERIWAGDGIRYAVFKVAAEPRTLIADFSDEKNETFETTVNELTADADFEIPNSLLPDWEAEYNWKHIGKHIVDLDEAPLRYSNNMYMIYFPATLCLVICVDLK